MKTTGDDKKRSSRWKERSGKARSGQPGPSTPKTQQGPGNQAQATQSCTANTRGTTRGGATQEMEAKVKTLATSRARKHKRIKITCKASRADGARRQKKGGKKKKTRRETTWGGKKKNRGVEPGRNRTDVSGWTRPDQRFPLLSPPSTPPLPARHRPSAGEHQRKQARQRRKARPWVKRIQAAALFFRSSPRQGAQQSAQHKHSINTA